MMHVLCAHAVLLSRHAQAGKQAALGGHLDVADLLEGCAEAGLKLLLACPAFPSSFPRLPAASGEASPNATASPIGRPCSCASCMA